MKGLKRDLQSIMKDLKSLTQKTEKIAKKMKFGKAQPKRKLKAKTMAKAAKRRVAKKPRKVTAIDTIFAIIERRKRGIDTATLKKKTGFNDKKIYNVINTLKKQGKVKSARVGVYVKI